MISGLYYSAIFSLPIAPARLATVLFACLVITDRVVAGASSSHGPVCVAGLKLAFW